MRRTQSHMGGRRNGLDTSDTPSMAAMAPPSSHDPPSWIMHIVKGGNATAGKKGKKGKKGKNDNGYGLEREI